MKSTYCEYILEKILSTSEVGPMIAPSPLGNTYLSKEFARVLGPGQIVKSLEPLGALPR